jgi:hypothetical protein
MRLFLAGIAGCRAGRLSLGRGSQHGVRAWG